MAGALTIKAGRWRNFARATTPQETGTHEQEPARHRETRCLTCTNLFDADGSDGNERSFGGCTCCAACSRWSSACWL